MYLRNANIIRMKVCSLWKGMVLRMQFDNSYFQDEIREGFYIPGMIKRSWAMQIDVLEKIDEICTKYNIKWFADCGTLIGAVRHRGFIPWDDDLDICMLRDDYIRFNEIIKNELPDGYKLLNFDTETSYENFLTRIVASDGINTGKEYLMSHHGYPYTAGIDIFPLDYLYPDEEREELRRKTAKIIWELADNVINKKEHRSKEEISSYVSEITGYSLDPSLSVRAGLYRIVDKLFSECLDKSSGKVTLMPFYLKNKNRICLSKWYENIIMMPFENGYIKVPAAYNEILKMEYGSWYIANRCGGYHEYPVHAIQEHILIENNGTAPYLYVYNGIDKELKEARQEHAISTDGKKRLIISLDTLHKHIITFIEKKKYNEAAAILEKCQEIAITVGTAIDEEQGEGFLTVKYLEEYCELIYNIHGQLLTGSAVNTHQESKRLAKLYETIKTSYDNDIPKRRKVVFIPVNAKDWDYMSPLYEKYISAENTDVYVMPAFFSERADDGSMLTSKTDYEAFPKHLPLIKPQDFDLNRYHPDIIIIQNPFDEFESGFTVHPFFYAANLYKYTEKLVYCHSFNLDKIEEGNGKALINAEKFVITPGVVLSDEIYVPDENMKSVYVKLLGALPQNTQREWEEKIKILPPSTEKGTLSDEPLAEKLSDTLLSDGESVDNISLENEPVTEKPFLVFHVSDGDYISYDNVLNKIRQSIEIYENSKEMLDIVWVEDTKTAENIKLQSQKLYENYEAIKKDFVDRGIGKFIPIEDAANLVKDAAGYYGSAGYLLNLCVRAGIPTMVWEIELMD